jgi:hypothetical protein
LQSPRTDESYTFGNVLIERQRGRDIARKPYFAFDAFNVAAPIWCLAARISRFHARFALLQNRCNLVL